MKKKILIIEDFRQSIFDVIHYLRFLAEVTIANTRIEAEKFLKTEKYDLIILDWHLPYDSNADPEPYQGKAIFESLISFKYTMINANIQLIVYTAHLADIEESVMKLMVDRGGRPFAKPNSTDILKFLYSTFPPNIFIIHGSNTDVADRIRDEFQSTMKINPVLIKDIPSGDTIIHQVQAYGDICSGAIAILTEDDIVKAFPSRADESWGARPNVFIEIGWFIRHSSLKNVSLLVQKNVVIPSDLNGVKVEFFESDITKTFWWVFERLRAAAIIPECITNPYPRPVK